MPHTLRRTIEALYQQSSAAADFVQPAGVVHVVATWPCEDALTVIKIGEASPKSASDWFALNFARARADAIIVTGKILREEPTLRYDLAGPDAELLLRWRRQLAGKSKPPRLVVLSSGHGLDLGHRAFASWATPVVFTGTAGASLLRDAASKRQIELVEDPAPSLVAAIAWARAQGAETILLEAGPSSVAPLYTRGNVIDELLLSEFVSPKLDRALRGSTLVTRRRLHQSMRPLGEPVDRDELSGLWRFSRWRRYPTR